MILPSVKIDKEHKLSIFMMKNGGAKDKTIDSQIAALKEKIAADGGALIEDMIFIDAGVSGATLVRPELERLRDSAAIGAVDRVYLLSPDRLAQSPPTEQSLATD